MCLVEANAIFHGHKLTDIPVLNPGDWFGKAWLIEIGGGKRSKDTVLLSELMGKCS